MNKQLFSTRIKSIIHYNAEVANLKDALKVTESTLRDVIDSIREFFPFEQGDVITDGVSILKFFEVSHINNDNDPEDIGFYIKYYKTDGYTWFERNATGTKVITVGDLPKWKKIF